MIKRSLSTVRHQEKLREDKAKITPEPKLEKDAQDLAELIDQIRAENEKYLAKRQADAKAAQEKRTFGKNENPEPNLIASTKLMLRDTFRTDKRMGARRLLVGLFRDHDVNSLVDVPPCAYCPNLAGGGTGFCDDGNGDYGLFLMCFYILEMFTGLIRRFRDAEIPVLYVVLALTVVGEIICLFLATRPKK